MTIKNENERKDNFLSLRIDDDMVEHLAKKSSGRRISVSDLVREMILRDMGVLK